MDVAVRTLAMIGFVGDLCRLVPVGGKNALATRALEGVTEAANAAEEVYEAQMSALTPALFPRRGRIFASHTI